MPSFFNRARGIELTHHHKYMRRQIDEGEDNRGGPWKEKSTTIEGECEKGFFFLELCRWESIRRK